MKKYKILKKASLGLSVSNNTGLNSGANPQWFNNNNSFSEPGIEVNKSLHEVNDGSENLEAEGGETAFTDLTGDGIPQLYKIKGDRHYNGGVKLNLPEDSFIFSRDKKMKIAGDILNSFGKPKGTKDKYTPAELSNQYPINDFRKVLADPDTDKLQRDTAEAMIANYNLKLAKLGLVQESSKGFPDGLPAIAMPYIDMMNIDPSQFVSPQGQQEVPGGTMAQYGGPMKRQTGGEGWLSAAGKNDPSTGYWDRVKGANLFQRTGDDDVDPRMHQAFEKLYGKGATGFGDWIQNLFTMPEKEINNLLTGYYEGPGTTAKRYDPDTQAGWINLAADPMMYPELPYAIGKGAVKGVAKAAPYVASAATTAAKATAKYGKKAIDLVMKYVPNFNMGTLATVASRLGQAGLHLDDNTTPEDIQKALESSAYSSEKEYKAHLLDPYSKEKAAAQQAWNLQAPPQYTTTPTGPAVQMSQVIGPKRSSSQQLSDTTSVAPKQDTIDFSKLSDAELKKILNSKRLGGSMPTYQGGGSYTPEQKARAAAILAARKKKVPASSTPKTLTPVEKFDAYGVVSPEMISKFLTPEQAALIRKEPVEGLQHTSGEGIFGKGVSVDEFLKRNPKWAAKNPGFDPKKNTEKFQNEYNDFVEKVAYDDAIEKGYPEKRAQELSKGWVATQGFKSGTKVKGDPRYKDKDFGEFTSNRFEPQFAPYDKGETPVSTKEIIAEAAAPVVPGQEYPAYKTPKPAWWLQDKIKTAGAFSDLMRIKKYDPWQATPAVAYGERTFYDPTRELASNAEQVNMGIQGAQTFSGPQSFAATAAYLQGQGSKNAADIMGRYNNMNVQASNSLSDMNTGIFNQAAQQRAGNATQLFDKQTIANQQFDNSKNLARQNLRQGFIDAVTNRANTYNLNTLYPQYAVDPNTGGMTYNIPGSNRELNRNQAPQQTPESIWNDLLKRNTREDAEIIFKNMYGNKGQAPNQGFPNYTV